MKKTGISNGKRFRTPIEVGTKSQKKAGVAVLIGCLVVMAGTVLFGVKKDKEDQRED